MNDEPLTEREIRTELQLLLKEAEHLYNMIFDLDRAVRTPHPAADAFGFETDNVITRRPCGRCHGLTEKDAVRCTLGDSGVICERCMDNLGLLDEYNFVRLSWNWNEVDSEDVFADLQRRYRDGERVTATEDQDGVLVVERIVE